MKYISALLLACCMMAAQQLQAQVTVTGQLTDKDNKLLVLPYASIINKTTGKRAYTDQGGFYRISANPRDLIIFTFVGYRPDSIIVQQASGTETRNVELQIEGKVLRSVEVTAHYTPYQLDSIARRDQYGFILDKENKPLAGGSTPQGFGLTFSPITRFSRREKQKREFKKNFEKAEQERYVDSRYTPVLVSQVTGLKGDSLLQFMQDNHPDYETMRMMRQEDLLYWITDKYRAWKKK
ncbi:MAG TPA: carboxypeptidase-like regulatory domain-containing protein [Chitinophaga sp.]